MRTERIILFICAVALVIRLSVCFIAQQPRSDCVWYHNSAVSLASGDGFSVGGSPTAYRMPGYSFLLSSVYRATAADPLFGRIFNALAGVLIVWLVFRITLSFAPINVALCSAGIAAFYPELIIYTNALSTEIVFTVTLLTWIYCVIRNKSLVLSGLCMIAMVYLRSNALPLALLPIAWDRVHWKKNIAIFIIGFVALIPWCARNYNEIGSVSPSTNFWANLWIGNHNGATGGYVDTPDIKFDGEPEAENYFKASLLSDFKAKLFNLPTLIPAKLFYFFIPATTPTRWGLLGNSIFNDTVAHGNLTRCIDIILTGINLILILLSTYSIYKHRFDKKLLLVILFFVATSILFFGNDRFRLPVVPLLIIGAVSGFGEIVFHRFSTR
jgi:hypothetical protein